MKTYTKRYTNVRTANGLVVAIYLSCLPAASAAIYELNTSFGETEHPPAAAVPWLTVTTGCQTPGTVLLELQATALTAGEHITEWYLNVDPTLDPSQLVFTPLSQTGLMIPPTVALGSNAFKADGDGYFDVLISFAHTGSECFGAGSSITFEVTNALGTLDSSCFGFFNTKDDADGTLVSAAHVGTTGPSGEGSAWIAAVPEPGVGFSAGLGAIAVLVLLRRRDPSR